LNYRTERRPAEYILVIARANQVGQVRVAARELFDLDFPLGALYLTPQVFGQRAHIDFFTRADGSNFRNHQKLRVTNFTAAKTGKLSFGYPAIVLRYIRDCVL